MSSAIDDVILVLSQRGYSALEILAMPDRLGELETEAIKDVVKLNVYHQEIEQLKEERDKLHKHILHQDESILRQKEVLREEEGHVTSDQDKRKLWIALLFAETVGDRIIIGQNILGAWPEDIFDDDECPLCHVKVTGGGDE